MNIIKKFVVIIIITFMILLGIIPQFSYAGSLNDAQRKALVDVVKDIIDNAGEKSRALRYSQDHRDSGYNWSKVSNGKQTSAGTVNLLPTDLPKLQAALAKALGIDDVKDAPVVLHRSYKCRFIGDDISDTIAFDCSSFVSAAYRFTVGTEYDYPWTTGTYDKNSNGEWFKKKSLSEVQPGDILWKKGHVAIYLGDCRGDGKNYMAEASGFVGTSRNGAIMRGLLVDFLCSHPTYIIEHPDSNNKQPKLPELQIPKEVIVDVSKQVTIREYKWKGNSGDPEPYALEYIGPINKGYKDVIDVTNLTTTNPGDGSGVGSEANSSTNTSGLTHGPIVLPGNNTVVWPKDMVLEDQILATSEGYFYKGTPTYGQYVGRVSLFNWLIEGTENVLDWLIGFVTYAVKAVLIGWTAIVENVMSNILNFGIEPATQSTANLNESMVLTKVSSSVMLGYTEETAKSKLELTPVVTLADNENNTSTTTNTKPSVTQTSDIDASETKKKITVEDIIFNRVPVLDINFFEF